MLPQNGDDFSQTPVPETATVSGWRIALTKLGAVVALPGFVAGAQIGFTYGVARGLIAIAIGGLLLTGIAIATSMVAVRTRLTASLLIQRTFGTIGSRFVNGVLATILLGWFGVTAQLFGASLAQMIAELSGQHIAPWPLMIGGGILMVTTALFGFRGLQRLADVTIPALLLVLLVATWRALDDVSWDALLAVPADAPPLGSAISAIVGSLATGVVVFPDLARFARRRTDAAVAAFLTFAIGMPTVLMLAAIPSTATHQHDLIAILTILGLGIPAFVILVLKAWASNSGNLYSASLGLRTLFPKVGRSTIACAAGTVGIAFALLGISNYFLPLLMLLGITIPALAGIYVADFVILGDSVAPVARRFHWRAFLSWAAGITVATLTSRGIIHLSGVAALDSIVTSFLVQFALMRIAAGQSKLPLKVSHGTE